MTSPSTNLVWQLTTATRLHRAVIFAALVSAVGSVVVPTAVTMAPVAVMDAALELFGTRDESVNTFMIPAALSPQKRVSNFLVMASSLKEFLR